eukprot:TRINITY_DN7784_c0_g1_i1.p1 TRINITY_DN7784_c0_g1~~TRINITY_DN7784_c0_g1_i1.p1  ORF type:complete len:668 (-),score=202.08 TRINITY_DN7784_c0_g1_i1:18-2021(-)
MNEAKKLLTFVLEYMDNGSLASQIRQLGSLPDRLAASYIKQALSGLAYLHSQNIIHRDIKGDNMLISKDGRVCLSDFGLAISADPSDSAEGMDVVGTPYWLAPEVIMMTEQTIASDIWSIGCTVIQLITGEPPYGNLSPMGAIFRMVQEDHPPFPLGISADLESFLTLCFDKNTTRRWTAVQLENHQWIPSHNETSTSNANISDDTVRDTIEKYNRRPAISVWAAPSYLEEIVRAANEQAASADKDEAIDKEIEGLRSLTTNGQRILDVIEKLENKRNLTEKRIKKRERQEDAISKLSKLYGKFMTEDKDNCEKQLRIIRESLFMDIRIQKQLDLQLGKLKSEVYLKGKVSRDLPPTDSQGIVTYVEGDPRHAYVRAHEGEHVFILSSEGNVFQVEHTITQERGFALRDDIVTYRKASSTDNLKEPDALLHNIEERNRKEKLENLLGTGPEFDNGIRRATSATKIHRVVSSEPTSPTGMSPVGSPTASPGKSKIRGLTRFFGRSSPSSEDLHKKHRSPSMENTLDSGMSEELTNLLQEHGSLVIDGRDWQRDGWMCVASSQDHDLKERYIFLFANSILVTKRNGEKKFRLKDRISLEDARPILVADDGVFQNSFQIVSKSVTYTFTATGTSLVSAATERDSWFFAIRQLVRAYRRSQYESSRTMSPK